MQTFSDWMQHALYGPKGYYASGEAQSGREGDYFTAPDTGLAFGVLLGAIFEQWADSFAARPFHLVECGAGTGKLARQLESCPLPYMAIEKSAARFKILQETKRAGMTVYPDLLSIPARPLHGVIFSNELFDAMPVHRIRVHEGRLQEGFVTPQGEMFWGNPSTPALEAYFSRLHLTLPEGYETEVNLAMRAWMKEAAQTLQSGLVVAIDYGRPAWQYYDRERSGGTLRIFKDHVVRKLGSATQVTLGVDPPVDMTADIDFTSLALDGIETGFEPIAFMELGTFLMNGARAILGKGDYKAKAPSGMRYLLHPEGMGSAFHVLVLGKGIDKNDWAFEGNRLSRLGLPSWHCK